MPLSREQHINVRYYLLDTAHRSYPGVMDTLKWRHEDMMLKKTHRPAKLSVVFSDDRERALVKVAFANYDWREGQPWGNEPYGAVLAVYTPRTINNFREVMATSPNWESTRADLSQTDRGFWTKLVDVVREWTGV